MPHPGRPKGRMNKKTQAAQAMQQEALARQQAAQMQAAQANRAGQGSGQGPRHQHLHPHRPSAIKEEAGIQLHDEADLITYRNDALIRYMSNHEYIENVTAKPIHSSKIIPPSLYPTLPKRNVEDYANVNAEEIFYGDIQYMKHFDEQLVKSLEVMKQEDDPGYVKYLFNTDNYPYRRAKFSKLSELQQELNDKDSVAQLEREYESIMKESREKYHQEYKFQSGTKVYSIPLKSLASDVEVKRAPDDYNPKDFDQIAESPKQQQQQEQQQESRSPRQQVVSNAGNNLNEAPPAIDDGNGFNSNNIDLDLDDNANDMFQFVNDDENGDDFGNIASPIISGNEAHVAAQAQTQPSHSQPPPPQQQQQQQQQQNALKSQDDKDNSSTQMPQDMVMTAESSSNNDNIRSDTNGLDTDEQSLQQSQQQSSNHDEQMENNDVGVGDDDQLNNAMVAEINDLFSDSHHGHDHDHDMDHSAIVNDDIGDLYNFGQGDNGDLLGGSEFEQDFLSQINHSIE
ncbi:unnamed protein product [Candida parapsilosis]|nr:hypothetical protein K4G60_g5109 [Candida parapsilosis]KAI5911180.1 hypothetical protein K4G61_g4881 [Candida parapsilosis]CAD1809033.1 unnamed protein product [Candida parapsilosis]